MFFKKKYLSSLFGFTVILVSAYLLVKIPVNLFSYNSLETETKSLTQLAVLPTNKEEVEIKMLFFGDLMLDRQVAKIIENHSLNDLLSKLNEENFTSGYDLVGANLEGAVTNKGAHYLPHNLYDFAFQPEIVAKLKKYGFNFFTVANNHLADQGIRGIEETYLNLSKLDFNYVGCQDKSFFLDPENLATDSDQLSLNNCAARLIEIKGDKIIFLAFSIVYGMIEEDLMIENVKLLKNKADYLVVLPHWGIEYQSKASLSQERLAKKLIDAGADLIIGSHPHVIQNYEIYNNKPIFYSLGNFIFDQYFSLETQKGLAVSLNLRKNHPPTFDLYQIITENSKIELIEKIEK
jgi:gamma-polyglutamate biosynthesis protein CapA